MNWDCIAGRWEQATGIANEYWGRLIDDQFVEIAGKRQQLAAKARVSRGLARESAERQHRAWEARYEQLFSRPPKSH